jgi:hypothetical protein
MSGLGMHLSAEISRIQLAKPLGRICDCVQTPEIGWWRTFLVGGYWEKSSQRESPVRQGVSWPSESMVVECMHSQDGFPGATEQCPEC